MSNHDEPSGVRLDIWLDVACLFRTRSEAQKACKGGKIDVNGQPAKPNRLLRPGDNILIGRPFGRKQRLVVKAVADKHVSKADARLLYARFANAHIDEAVFTRAFMHHSDLTKASGESARFTWARLMHATLRDARCSGADLTGACLRFADCRGADLSFATLEFADAPSVKLTAASLRGALVLSANLDGASLAGADFTDASFGRTVVTSCHDLERAIGLVTISHVAPSSLDVNTFQRLRTLLPAAFLAGIGVES